MSNEIPASGLQRRDGHVPSTWIVLDAILSVRLGLQESMKNPRLNGDNRTTPGLSLHRRRTGGGFFFFPNTVRSVRMMLSSRISEKADERTNELACFSARFMKSGRGGGTGRAGRYPIWRGIRSRRTGTRLITVIRASTRSAGMWNEPARDGKLIWIHICVNFRLWRVRPPRRPRTLLTAFALLEILRKNSRRFNVNRNEVACNSPINYTMMKWSRNII